MADRYWVGGTGFWNSTNTTNWAANSGGAGGQTVPTLSDDVFFDANSGTGNASIVNAAVSANSINCAGYTGTIFAGQDINLYGNLWLNSGMTYTQIGTVTVAGGNSWITTSGETMGAFTVSTTGTVNLADDFTAQSINSITINSGTFNTNNNKIYTGSFLSTAVSTRAINLGSSNVSLAYAGIIFSLNSSSLTLNAASSNIVVFSSTDVTLSSTGVGVTLGNVNFLSNSSSNITITGANSFGNLLLTGPSGLTRKTITLPAAVTNTIRGNIVTTGTTGRNRILMRSSTYGVRTIINYASGAKDFADIDFQDISVSPSTISAIRIGDLGFNLGFAFSSKTVYWNLAGGGDWNANAWAATSGGTVSDNNFPLAQDTAIIENTGLNSSASIFLVPGVSISSIDMSTRTNPFSLYVGNSVAFYGNWINGSGTTVSTIFGGFGNSLIFQIRGNAAVSKNQSITSAGKTFPCDIYFAANTANVTLSDPFVTTANAFLVDGGLNLGGNTLTTVSFNSPVSASSNVKSMTFSSGGQIRLTGNASIVWFAPWVAPVAGVTTFSIYGNSNVALISNSTVGTRTVSHGNACAFSQSESVSLNMFVTNGSDTIDFQPTGSVGPSWIRSLNTTGFRGNIGNVALFGGNLVVGNSTSFISSSLITFSCASSAGSSTEQTITTSGRTINCSVTLNSTGSSSITSSNLTLVDNLTIANTRVFTHTAGNLILNNKILTTGAYDLPYTVIATKSIAFGNTGQIILTGQNIAIWRAACVAPSSFSYIGTSNVQANIGVVSVSPGTRTIFHGNGAGGEQNSLNFNIIGSTGDTINATGNFRDLTITTFGFSSLQSATRTIYGNLTLPSGYSMSPGVSTPTTFAANNAVQTIFAPSTTFPFSLIKSGTGNLRLLTTITVGTPGITFTLTQGNLVFDSGVDLVTPIFDASGANVKGIQFNVSLPSNITLTGSANTILNLNGSTNFSVTGGTGPTPNGRFFSNYNGSSGTRTFDLTGLTESQVIASNLSVSTSSNRGIVIGTTATDAISLSGSYYDFDLTGLTANLFNRPRTIYGNLTIPASSGNLAAGANVTNLQSSTGNRTITTNGRSIPFPLAQISGNLSLVDNLSFSGNTGYLNIIAGTFDTNNKTITAANITSASSSPTTINLGSSTLSLYGNAANVAVNFGSFATVTGTSQINLTANATTIISSANLYNIAYTTSANVDYSISGNFACNNFQFYAKDGTFGSQTYSLAGNITILGTLSTAGFYRTKLISSVPGTQRTLSINSFTGTSIDFTDINVIGNASPISGNTFGDGGNNSNINFISKTVYWNLGGNVNYTDGFAATSGGTANVANYPLSQDTAIFDNTGAANIVTIPSGTVIGNIDFSARTLPMEIQGSIILSGNAIFSNSVTYTSANLTFPGTRANVVQQITGNGASFSIITVNLAQTSSQVRLQNNLGANVFNLISGTIDLNNQSFTANYANISSTGLNLARSINFGDTGVINLGGGGVVGALNPVIWDGEFVTNFTYSGNSNITCTYTGNLGSRTIGHGATGFTIGKELSFNIISGSDAVAPTGRFKDLNFTGFNGAIRGTGATVYGNFTVGSNSSFTASAAGYTFASNSDVQTITTNGVLVDQPWSKVGLGTLKLADNLTMGNVRTFTLGQGTLNLNEKSLTVGIFSSNVSNVRSLAFGTSGQIILSNTATVSTIVWSAATLTNFSYTGTSNIQLTGNGSINRTISHGNLAGGAESGAVSFWISSGSDSIATAATSWIKDLNFTGFTGTLTNTARNIFGNLTLDPGMTLTAGTAITALGASGGNTQTITTNNETLDFPVTKNGSGIVILAGNLTLGNTRTFTLGAGNLELNGQTLSTGIFDGGIASTRVLSFGINSQILLTSSSTTILSMSSATNLSTTGNVYFLSNYTGSAGTRTFNLSGLSEAQVQAGYSVYTSGTRGIVIGNTATDLANIYGSFYDVDLTGLTCNIVNSTKTIYGNLVIPATDGNLSAGGLFINLAATTGNVQTITTNGRTIEFPIAKNGTGNVVLVGNVTLGNTRTFVLNQGNLDLNNQTLSTGTFDSSSSNDRLLLFGNSSRILLTGSNVTILNVPRSGLNSSGNVYFLSTYTSNIGTRTIVTTGLTEGRTRTGYNVYTSGTRGIVIGNTATDLISLSGSFCDIDLTGLTANLVNVSRTIYGNLTIPTTGGNISSGNIATNLAASSSNIQLINTNNRTLNFPINKTDTGNVILQSNFALSTYALTVSAGTFDANNWNLTLDRFVTTGAAARQIIMGSGTWTLSNVGTATTAAVIWNSIPTNLTVTPGTANIVYSGNPSYGAAFIGGNQSYNRLTITANTSGFRFAIANNNTFSELVSTSPNPWTLHLGSNATVNSNVTINSWSASGNIGNLVQIRSGYYAANGAILTTTAYTSTLSKSTNEPKVIKYANIQNVNATPVGTWVVKNSQLGGNISGWSNAGSSRDGMRLF